MNVGLTTRRINLMEKNALNIQPELFKNHLMNKGDNIDR